MTTLLMNGKNVTADLLAFVRDLVRIKSYSGREEQIIRFIAGKMSALGFDEVQIDRYGNVLGRVGAGEKTLMI